MELSREEVVEIAQETAQKVLEGIHRYAVDYKEPETIAQGLADSMIEERTAVDWYRRRGMDARLKGDEVTADLYEHIAKEEDQHHQELKERADHLLTSDIVTHLPSVYHRRH
jgi:rubrerythrin